MQLHNLKFSTDPNQVKCKTKLMAFLKKPRDLPNLSLCGNPLPWVNKIKHLGNTISNVMDGCQLDIKVKLAKYVDKSISLCQEFYFAHPKTKVKLNNIYNNHFTGSQLWKLGSRGLDKFEATYNRSVKIMFDLPWATHRYFVEPLTDTPHMSRTLAKRYLSFIDKVRNSKKESLRQLLQIVEYDARTTTGSNLRTIMTRAGCDTVDQLKAGRGDFEYHPVSEEEVWRINFLKELVEVKHGELSVAGMNMDELEQIMVYLCTT